MGTFRFTTKDGKVYELTAPDAATARTKWNSVQASGPVPAGTASSGADTSIAPPSTGPTAAPAVAPPNLTPGSPEYANWARDQAAAGRNLPQVSAPAPAWSPPDSIPAPLRAFSTGAVEGIPVAGPLIHNARDAMLGPGGAAYADAVDAGAANAAPVASTAGQVFGAVAPFVAGGEIPLVAKGLGMASDIANPVLNFGARTAASALSSSGISAADSAARGESPQQIGQNAVASGAVGAVAPGLGDIISGAVNKVGNLIHGVADPIGAGQRVIGDAAAKDIAAGNALSPMDEANATMNGQPLINADRFGANVQTLARTAANLDPTAKQALADTVRDRFLNQNDRGVQFINRLVGGNSDALGAQTAIHDAARAANRPAYFAAYNDPAAQAIMTPQLGNLLQSPLVRGAISKSTATGADDAAIHGFPAVTNPFRFSNDGSGAYQLTRRPDGSVALPNLPFWDQVQRNLRRTATMAAQQGDLEKAGRAGTLRGMLNSELDNAVPAFQQARQGAAAAFGADDALEAGQKYVTAPAQQIPSLTAAHANFSPSEKRLFATGAASGLINKINAAPDTTNVIDKVFDSPVARQQIATAFSPYTPKAAQHLEHFMRIEDIMNQTKQAVQGGSNTVAQAAAAAALGGYGTGAVTGGSLDPRNWNPNTWRNAATGAGLLGAGRVGMQKLGMSVDQKVMQSVATALSSRDPAAIDQVIRNATNSKQTAGAIKAIQHGLQTTLQAAGSTVPAALSAPQPVDPSTMLPTALN